MTTAEIPGSGTDPDDAATRGRRPRVPAAVRRTQLLDAAAAIVAGRGIEGVTLQRVAQQADVNQAIIYRFFRNRDDLLLALCEREAGRFEEALRQELERCDGFEEHVRALVRSYIDARLGTLPTIDLRLTTGPDRSPELQAWRVRRDSLRIAFIAGLFQDRFPELAAPDAVILASTFGAGIEGIVRLAEAGTPPELLEERFATMCIGAAGAITARSAG